MGIISEQAVVDFVDHQLVHKKEMCAKLPLLNWHDTRVAKIAADFGQRTIDTADGVERALGEVLETPRKMKECAMDLIHDAGEQIGKAVLDEANFQAKALGQKIGKGIQEIKDSVLGGKNEISKALKGAVDGIKQANDSLITELTSLSAGYNKMLSGVDALAYRASSLAGGMQQSVCGAGPQVAALTQRALDMVGLQKRDELTGLKQAARNNTRTLVQAKAFGDIASLVTCGVPAQKLPDSVPGAAQANSLIEQANEDILARKMAISRQLDAADKLNQKMIQSEAAVVALGAPAEAPASMPPVTPEKYLSMMDWIDFQSAVLVKKPGSVMEEHCLTAVRPVQITDPREVREARTLPPPPGAPPPPPIQFDTSPPPPLPGSLEEAQAAKPASAPLPLPETPYEAPDGAVAEAVAAIQPTFPSVIKSGSQDETILEEPAAAKPPWRFW